MHVYLIILVKKPVLHNAKGRILLFRCVYGLKITTLLMTNKSGAQKEDTFLSVAKIDSPFFRDVEVEPVRIRLSVRRQGPLNRHRQVRHREGLNFRRARR